MSATPITQQFVRSLFFPRRPDTHKGSYGRLLCIAGSMQYRGAAALCTEGGLRGGAGLVQLAAPEPVIQGVWTRLPECILLPCRTDEHGLMSNSCRDELAQAVSQATALAVGPGLGKGRELAQMLQDLIEKAPCPVVLDADGINMLAELPSLPLPTKGGLVITPHPGEMARLTSLSVADIAHAREHIAGMTAKAHHCTVVLKGSNTVVAGPDGELFVNNTGNPGLARGGSGDILTGLIGSFMAQGLSPLHAAAAGVWLHGAAADRCAARKSQTVMLPCDIFEDLGAIFAEWGL